MKKVLIVASDGLTKSGVPNLFINIIRNLHDKGYCFDVLYFDDENAFYKNEITSYGGKAIFCSSDLKKKSKIKKLSVKMNYTKTFKKILKDNGPYYCVHSFKGYESGYVLKAAKQAGIEHRIAHMTFRYRKSSNAIVNLIESRERRLTEKYSSYIVSDSKKTSIINNPSFKRRVVINNFYDESTFSYSELSRQNDGISLIQIGSYCENKNQAFTLSVFKNIVKQYPNSMLHFIGFRNPDDKDYLDRIKELVISEALNEHVVFHNFDADASKIFKECNYLMFPSISESFGIVAIEAQASGLTCFCSDTITDEGNCGGCVYLSIEDPLVWKDKIIQNFIETKGKHKVFDVSKFSSEKIVKDYQMIYEGNYQIDEA